MFLINIIFSELYVANETQVGGTVHIFVDDVDNKGYLTNGTVFVTNPSNHQSAVDFVDGQTQIMAVESGEWFVEYKGIKKTFYVTGDANSVSSARVDENPYVIFLIIIILGMLIGGAIILFTLNKAMKHTFEFSKKYDNNSVTLIFQNNTEQEVSNVIIEDEIPEDISNVSIPPENEKKGKLVWKLKKVKPGEAIKIKYQAVLDKTYSAYAKFKYMKENIIIDSSQNQESVVPISKKDKPMKSIRKMQKISD